MTNPVPIHQQIEAVEIVIGVAVGTRPKPRPAEMEKLLERANAGVKTLRWNEAHADKLRRAFGNVEGDGL
jgi:hypothetical protein